MKILTVLGAIFKIEMAAGELYRWLSEVLADDKEAASLFFRMSMQEQSHANLINYARRLINLNPGDFGDVSIDLNTVNALLDELVSFRRSNLTPTVEQALRFAISIEENAAERVHRSMVIDSNPMLHNIINSLAKADDEHTRGLKTFAKHRGLIMS